MVIPQSLFSSTLPREELTGSPQYKRKNQAPDASPALPISPTDARNNRVPGGCEPTQGRLVFFRGVTCEQHCILPCRALNTLQEMLRATAVELSLHPCLFFPSIRFPSSLFNHHVFSFIIPRWRFLVPACGPQLQRVEQEAEAARKTLGLQTEEDKKRAQFADELERKRHVDQVRRWVARSPRRLRF